jgi:hypothetical protein
MVGIVASHRQRAHCCTCVGAQVSGQQVPGQTCRPIVGRKMVGGILIGALSISLLVTGATVTLAQNSAMSPFEPAANAGVATGVPLPSPQLLEHQSKPDCESPPSDRLLGAIPETMQLIHERECYKNAETAVRAKLQLLQEAIASTIKALNDAAASRTLPPAEGGEQGAPAPAKDAAIAPKAGASAAKSSEATGTAGDRRDAKSDPSGDQGVEPPDQHRRPTPINPSSREGVACQTSKPAGHGSWAWRLIDGRKCWYEGAVGMDKSILHWPPPKDVPRL